MKKEIPVSSYRIQLSQSFCFEKARCILPYLNELGIEMVYTSPYFERVKNSSNPYLITSPLSIAKELGGEKAFFAFCKECKRLSIQHMMDIVPNHMAAHPENPWWKDVIQNKSTSKYAPFFDIDWEGGDGKLILPGAIDIHEKINYRRFFDICEMVGINIENDDLYNLYFSKIKEYVEKGLVQGFRVDHIDGLKYPKKFLDKIDNDFPHLYVALEKIVQDGELIRDHFKCDGSVGYDILFLIDQVLLDKRGEELFTKLYLQNREEEASLVEMKISYLNHYLISEVNRFTKAFGVEKENLLTFLANFPIYRTYIDQGDIDPLDREAIEYAAKFTKGSFFKEEIYQKEHRESLIKLQQILPAIFAKGFEDTFNYRHVTLSSLNEVGGDPLQFSISNEKFHQRIETIFDHFPNTMHTLSTHDTKRSLDARMRLHVLAEIKEEFLKTFNSWKSIVVPFESSFLMFFFFQSLLAVSEKNNISRLSDYMIKVVREGKYYSDHLSKNAPFEKRLKEWVFFALTDKKAMEVILPFKEKVIKAAEMKSLCALVLQMGLAGVMDIYQGEELLNANLVDPDNRRAVDFERRKKVLKDRSSLKMNILKRGLHFRKEYRELLQKGSYEKMVTPNHQIGYKRCYKGKVVTVMINKYGNTPFPPNKKSIFPEDLPFYVSIS
ncbi:MAG: putative maltooligosyl trehalose synthase [Chlamydiia bacterium]|nr:putative maltooligosyl trehalose synthase [Chlamydiia bacterium]MCH9618713.1 putative maltooligosyl trehalose synthase [Chlamydiia bacterium]MCH9624393.1 putative maltooligosyl trehalose synthase [Chlamydiia bacterium]